jgi:hypothetical protein
LNKSVGLVGHGTVSPGGAIRANSGNPSSLAWSGEISIEQAGSPGFPGFSRIAPWDDLLF